MGTTTETFRSYLRETLDADPTPTPWEGERQLPLLLRDRYRYYTARLFDRQCLLMVDRDEDEQTPAKVRKHIDQLRDRWDGEIIYVNDRTTAYNRQRLIEQKVAFVVPGNQMYLPTLGIDLREHFRKLRHTPETFTPSAQSVVIYWLLTPECTELNPSDTARRLGRSRMTMTRAFDEIEATQLADVTTSGRERLLVFECDRRQLWKRIQPYLRSPVRTRHAVVWNKRDQAPEGVVAGLSALAQYSMLADPKQAVIALSSEAWKTHKQMQSVRIVDIADEGTNEIEVWRYPPTLFASNGMADRLSVYLSLRDTNDERIEAALEDMMEQLPW